MRETGGMIPKPDTPWKSRLALRITRTTSMDNIKIIETKNLKASDVPTLPASRFIDNYEKITSFGLSFDGYKYLGESSVEIYYICFDLYKLNGHIPENLNLKRALLFLFLRELHMGGDYEPKKQELEYIGALLNSLRRGLDLHPSSF
jgi:hypothetical protein